MADQHVSANITRGLHQIDLVAIVDRAATQQHLTGLIEAQPPTQRIASGTPRSEQASVRFQHAGSEIRAVTDKAEHPCHAGLRVPAVRTLCARLKHTAQRRAWHALARER